MSERIPSSLRRRTQIVQEKISSMAWELQVHRTSPKGETLWRWWMVIHAESAPEKPSQGIGLTYVLQGPVSIIVAGSLANLVFERAGGLGLGFPNNGLEYAAEKCRSGNFWGYNPNQARKDLEQYLSRLEEEYPQTKGFGSLLSDLTSEDFENPNEIYSQLSTYGLSEIPPFGREPSMEALWALACIWCVWKFEERS